MAKLKNYITNSTLEEKDKNNFFKHLKIIEENIKNATPTLKDGKFSYIIYSLYILVIKLAIATEQSLRILRKLKKLEFS